jgi:hypothetical protein
VGAERLKKLATQLEELVKDKDPNLDQLNCFVTNIDQQFSALMNTLKPFVEENMG